MSFVNKNLRYLRLQRGWTQKDLAEKLDVKQPVIGAYEEERAVPPLFTLTRMAELFAVTLDALVQTDLSKPVAVKKNVPKKEVLAITVNASDTENIELVVQKAAAGYLTGFQDPEFIADLPKISMPLLPRNRTHRAFEIQGDSMLPILPGTIVFGEYVESIHDIKNGKCYMLVTKHDGIVFKRLFVFAQHAGNLLCVSDNQKYHPYILSAESVMEIWQASAFFSKDFPEKDNVSSNITDKLALMYLEEKMK